MYKQLECTQFWACGIIFFIPGNSNSNEQHIHNNISQQYKIIELDKHFNTNITSLKNARSVDISESLLVASMFDSISKRQNIFVNDLSFQFLASTT